jgi:hypothetical protein
MTLFLVGLSVGLAVGIVLTLTVLFPIIERRYAASGS